MARPSKRRDLRARGFDESCTAEEVVAAIAEVGKCQTSDIKSGGQNPLRQGCNGHPVAAMPTNCCGQGNRGWQN